MAEGNGVAKRVADINSGDFAARSQVARAIEERFEADPALKAPGMPPLYGEFPIPHVMTLQGLVTTISRVYRVSDEALNDSVDNARFMEYDVGILECLEPRIRSSILLDWHIDPEDTNDPNQVFICGELTKIIKAIERWQQVLENLTMAVWPGKYGVWFHYGWNQVGGHWRIMPYGDPSWLPVHGDKLVFRLMDGRLDHRQNQVGIRVGQTYRMDETISKGMGRGREGEYWRVEPTDRGLAYFLSVPEQNSMMIHKHKINDAAFERPQDAGRIHGYGIRSQLYWEWFMEKNTLQWLMEYIERSAFGLELWYYPLGNEKARLDAETAVKKRTGPFKNVLFVPVPAEESGTPNQFGVDHVETGAQGADILISLIKDFFGARRKRFILGQVLTTEAEATGLGGNLASIHLLSFRDIVKYDSKNRDDTVSAWINRTLKPWNFPGNGNWKCRYVTETEPVDADAKLNALKTCQDMGAPISQKDIYKAAGVTPPQPGDILATPMMAAAPGMGGGPPGSNGPPPGGGPDASGSDPTEGTEPEVEETPEEVDQFSAYSDDLRNRIEKAAKFTEKPTKGQRHAGNYKKGKVTIQGVPVVIENPKGSYRHYEFEGKKGKQELHHHYGYISGTEGTDNGQLDCFIGPDPESELVYIVNQIVPKTGKFDELKVLIGWYCEEEAREGYLSNYEKGWRGLGSLVRMTMPQFKEWLEKGDQRRSMVRQTAFYSAEDYQGHHAPDSTGPELHNLTSTGHAPKDIYHTLHHYVDDPKSPEGRESIGAVKAAHGKPNAMVKVYRAGPKKELNHGDWVSLSKTYATQHGMHATDPIKDEPAHEFKVPAHHVRWAGDSLHEFGYFPNKEKTQYSEDHILSKMEEVEPKAKNGALVTFKNLRKASGMGKEEFDNHLLNLSREGKVSLHRHDYVAPMSEEELAHLVHDPHGESRGTGNHPKGTYYVGAALREHYSEEDHQPEYPSFGTKLEPAHASQLIGKIRAGDQRSKHKGLEQGPEHNHGPMVMSRVPLSIFNHHDPDYGTHLGFMKSSTDPKRVEAYKKQKIKTPIVVSVTRDTKKPVISDGGHRLVAAHERGDTHIDALVPESLHKELHGDKSYYSQEDGPVLFKGEWF